MCKEQNPRRVADNEAMAKTKMLRTSPQKLNLVAAMIRGKKVEKALADLTFSKRRIASGNCGDPTPSSIACRVRSRRSAFGIFARNSAICSGVFLRCWWRKAMHALTTPVAA